MQLVSAAARDKKAQTIPTPVKLEAMGNPRASMINANRNTIRCGYQALNIAQQRAVRDPCGGIRGAINATRVLLVCVFKRKRKRKNCLA